MPPSYFNVEDWEDPIIKVMIYCNLVIVRLKDSMQSALFNEYE